MMVLLDGCVDCAVWVLADIVEYLVGFYLVGVVAVSDVL